MFATGTKGLRAETLVVVDAVVLWRLQEWVGLPLETEKRGQASASLDRALSRLVTGFICTYDVHCSYSIVYFNFIAIWPI